MTENLVTELRQRFDEAMDFSNPADADNKWKQLDNLYSNKNRHYHNWDHIYEFIQQLDSLNLSEEESKWYVQATIYHDAIYTAGAKDNEEESLKLWLNHVVSSKQVPTAENLALVSCLILSTKQHAPFAVPFCAEFIDCDLAPLAYSANDYKEYVRKIRQEYGAFSDSEWISGRTKFLKHCLQQNGGSIFWSADVPGEQIQFAKDNINSELESLLARAK